MSKTPQQAIRDRAQKMAAAGVKVHGLNPGEPGYVSAAKRMAGQLSDHKIDLIIEAHRGDGGVSTR